jgi:hypothetical protein
LLFHTWAHSWAHMMSFGAGHHTPTSGKRDICATTLGNSGCAPPRVSFEPAPNRLKDRSRGSYAGVVRDLLDDLASPDRIRRRDIPLPNVNAASSQ